MGTRCIYLPDPSSVPTSSSKVTNPLECSIHILPKQLLREFRHVFRDECKNMQNNDSAPIRSETDQTPILLAIPTNQMARHDLVAIGDHIEAEKDRLLNVVSEYTHILIIDSFQSIISYFALIRNTLYYIPTQISF